MMMFSPGASVRVNLPNRSTVQAKPCGTVLMPANSGKITRRTIEMPKIAKPVINPPRRGEERPAPIPDHKLRAPYVSAEPQRRFSRPFLVITSYVLVLRPPDDR